MTRSARNAGWTALGVALAGLACRSDSQAQGPPPTPVRIEVARSVAVDDSSEYVATLRSRGSAAIMPQVEGHITRIFVRAGARVAAGEPLMQLDAAKQQATLNSQEDTRTARAAALAYARQRYERVQGLHASGIASQQDLDQARTALEAAQADLGAVEAQVREQQAQLRYYRVAAPAAGVVGDIPVRVGDRVTVSTLLTTVDSPGIMEAYVSVPVERAAQLRRGLPVRIVDGTGGVVAESHLTFVSPQVDDQTQTVLVKAGIAEPGALRPAQIIRARVVWGTREGPVVPVLAVSRISGQHFAFVAEEEKGALVARQRPVRVGEIVGNDYVVLGGIEPGDRVIVSGTQFLRDGAPVSPQT
ncbi:MAG TPA: efflux RND transporter periplasmic adaptor subunit [Vicinamibacteria bacterium]|nr:efflux RND transporter periplasmic adaptor subunit [Vicinamibacteria bacterium]